MATHNVDPDVAHARARLAGYLSQHPEDERSAELRVEVERAMLRHTLKRFTLPREEIVEIVLEGSRSE